VSVGNWQKTTLPVSGRESDQESKFDIEEIPVNQAGILIFRVKTHRSVSNAKNRGLAYRNCFILSLLNLPMPCRACIASRLFCQLKSPAENKPQEKEKQGCGYS